MNNFERLKSMSVEELSKWIDTHGQFDNSLWITWFDQKYCKNCENIMCKYENGERENFLVLIVKSMTLANFFLIYTKYQKTK